MIHIHRHSISSNFLHINLHYSLGSLILKQWWSTVCNNETVCNNLLQSVARIATLCNNNFFCYIASPFVLRFVTNCYIPSRCYIPCSIRAPDWKNPVKTFFFGSNDPMPLMSILNGGWGWFSFNYATSNFKSSPHRIQAHTPFFNILNT